MCPAPRTRLYWSKNLGIQYVSTLMTRVLFEHITKCLHFNDDSKMFALGEETFDKLFKIRPPITHLQSKFRDILTFPWKEAYFALNSSNKPFTWLQDAFGHRCEKQKTWCLRAVLVNRVYRTSQGVPEFCRGVPP